MLGRCRPHDDLKAALTDIAEEDGDPAPIPAGRVPLSPLTVEEVCERLAAATVPHPPVNGMVDALSTPYVADRGLVAEVATPEGSYRTVRGPLNDGRPLRPAPGLGEHTAEVLREVLSADAALLAELLAGSGPGAGAAPPWAG